MNTLKKTITLLLVIIVLQACKKNTEKIETKTSTHFSITGEIKGLRSSTLYYRKPGKSYENIGYWNDSIVVINDKFKLTDSINEYAFLTLNTRIKGLQKTTKSGGWYPVKSAFVNLIIHPGANIKVEGKVSDFMEAYPSGDPANDGLGKLHQIIFPLMNESVNYLVKSSFETDANVIEVLKKKADSVGAIADKIKIDFVKNNQNSIAGLYYISDMMMRSQLDDNEAIALYEKIDKRFKDNTFYKEITKRVQGIESTKEGQIVPDVLAKSALTGKDFDLKSYRGKYVMIDFWGTWCGPCVAEMPKVKEFSEKYADKLVVLGINSGDTQKKLKEYVESKGYKWEQVCSVKGSNPNNFVTKFNVTGFPTKFIIDPNGVILKKYLGSGDEAFTLLEELMEK